MIALIAPQQDPPLRRVAVLLVVTLALVVAAIGLAHYHGLPLRLGRSPFPHATNFMHVPFGAHVRSFLSM